MLRRLSMLLGCAACVPEEEATWDEDREGTLPADQLGPTPHDLTLYVSQAQPGGTFSAHVTGAAPGATVYIVRGGAGSSCPGVLAGTCLDLTNPAVILQGTADGSGRLILSRAVPPAVSPGIAVRFQAVSGLGGAVTTSAPWTRVTGTTCPGGPNEPCNDLHDAHLHADQGAGGWRVTPGHPQIITWDPLDLTGSPGSGSMRTTNPGGGAYTSAWQCVPVDGGETFGLRGWGLRDPDGTGSPGAMFVEYIGYAGDHCTGSLAGFGESTWATTPGVWTDVSIPAFTVASNAVSVRVGAGSIALSAAPADAVWDDLILLRQ